MSHEIFTVEFSDGRRLYGAEDTSTGYAYRFLFETPELVEDWIFSAYGDDGRFQKDRDERAEPANVRQLEETVTYDPDKTWSFKTRASWDARWLTGPSNSDELLSEEPWPSYGR